MYRQTLPPHSSSTLLVLFVESLSRVIHVAFSTLNNWLSPLHALICYQGPSGLHQYHLRTVFDEVPFPPDAPVLVNFHEAKAFAAWKTLKEAEVRPAVTFGVASERAI